MEPDRFRFVNNSQCRWKNVYWPTPAPAGLSLLGGDIGPGSKAKIGRPKISALAQ